MIGLENTCDCELFGLFFRAFSCEFVDRILESD